MPKRNANPTVAGKVLVACAAALPAGGCLVGPTYRPPAPPSVAGYTQGSLTQPAGENSASRQRFVPGGDVSGRWWTAFGSPKLDKLVEQALAANPTLDVVQAALDRSFEEVEAEKGTLFPSVSTNDLASYQKVPAGGLQSPLTNQSRYTYGLFTGRLAVSYAPDVFGGQHRKIESLAAKTEVRNFELEAAYLTLSTRVVLAAIEEAALREQIATLRKVVGAQRSILDLDRKELVLGQLSQSEVVQQEAVVTQTEQGVPPLEKRLAVQRNLIAALAGHLPGEVSDATFRFSDLKLPKRLPVSLPAVLVQQRPDVRAADALVHQAAADVGVAIAARLPQFRLTADVGSTAINLTQFGAGPTGFYTLASAVSAPLFDAGTLFHRQRAAEAGLVEAEARHKAVVIAAFQNVADSLAAIQLDGRSVAAAQAAETAASKSFEMIRKERAVGAANVPQVLFAQQNYLLGLNSLIQARAAQYADTVALFQALGGGWWNRSDVQAPPMKRDAFDFL